MPDARIPVSKPKADLEKVYQKDVAEHGGGFVIRYKTRFGKLFEREETARRGVVWYQVVQQ